MTERLGAYFWLTFASACWGLSFIWTKDVFQYWGPFSLCFLRMLLASVLVFCYMKLRRLRISTGKDFRLFLLMAICEPLIYFIGESYGIMEVSPGIAALVVGSTPIFLGISSMFYGSEKPKKSFFLGCFLSFAGLAVVSVDLEGNLRYSAKGLSLLFMAVASAVCYNQIIKKLAARHSPESIVFWQSFLGAILFLPFFLTLEARDFLKGWPFHRDVWQPYFLLTIFASTIAFIVYNQAIKKVGMLRSNLFVNLIPAFALFASFMMGLESLDWFKVVGLLLMVSGVIKASMKHAPELG